MTVAPRARAIESSRRTKSFGLSIRRSPLTGSRVSSHVSPMGASTTAEDSSRLLIDSTKSCPGSMDVASKNTGTCGYRYVK